MSYYIAVDVFVTPVVFWDISIWKMVDQGFYSKFSSKLWFDPLNAPFLFGFIVLISNNVHWCLEILTALHICSFLMPYDGGCTSLGDNETIVSYNHTKIWKLNLYFKRKIKLTKITAKIVKIHSS